MERVQLCLQRVEAVYDRRPSRPDGTAGAYLDVYSFFLHCLSLRDWILRDPNLSAGDHRAVRRRFSKDHNLRLCADVANRNKHCALTRASTGDKESGPSEGDVTIGVPTLHLTTGFGEPPPKPPESGPGWVQHAFRITSHGNVTDALELAKACHSVLEASLGRRGLL